MLILAAETLAGMAMLSVETVAASSDRLKRGEAMLGKKQVRKASATSMTRLGPIDPILNGYTERRKVCKMFSGSDLGTKGQRV